MSEWDRCREAVPREGGGFTREDAETLLSLLDDCPGPHVQFGVFHGRSGWLAADRGAEAWLYDTFSLFPEEEGEDEPWSGTHLVDYEAVRATFAPYDNVTLVRGDFTETALREGPEAVGSCLVDCDSYRGTSFAASWAWERLTPGGAIFFQDWGKPWCPGATWAVCEWLKHTPGVEKEYPPGGGLVARKPLFRVLIACWGHYLKLLPPCLAAWHRLWPEMPGVTLLGERPPWWAGEFLDTFPEPPFHPACYSRALREALEQIAEPVVYLIPSDTFPTGPVDGAAMRSLARYAVDHWRVQAHQHPHHPRLDDRRRHVCEWEGREMATCGVWHECSLIAGCGMDAAFWPREKLIDMLPDHWTFWEFEKSGTLKAKREGLVGVVGWPPLFRATDVLQNRTPGTLRHLEELLPEDQAAVEAFWRA